MAGYDLVVRNARIATASDVFDGDIGVRDGRIAAVSSSLEEGSRTIDAGGAWVTPGGVDAHCHLAQRHREGARMADDFHSGTISAAFGGTTTVIPFACQFKGETLAEVVRDYHGKARDHAVVDYAFHLIVSDPSPETLAELPDLVEAGYTHFKVYMTYDALKLSDRQMLDVFEVARANGALVMVHAENDECVAWLTERLERAGKNSPFDHAVSRPSLVESEATYRAIAFSELMDTPILFVHISNRAATEEILRAQGRGLRIYAETCPQYLFMTADDLNLDGFEGAKHVCSPPPRSAADQEYLWTALANGAFSIFSSDHAPFRFDDPQGKQKGRDRGFRWIPNGIPGLETRVPLLFDRGVLDGRIDIRDFVRLTATEPARMYGLYPRKGTIAVGGDADLVTWREREPFKLTNAMLHHNVDYTPYEGMSLRIWPETVVSRGDVVVDGGELYARPGRGSFLESGRPDPARPARPDETEPWFSTLN